MNANSTASRLWLTVLLYMASVIVLLFPAILNGYPFLHGDSGVVIISGFEHFAPIERPISYGLFTWVTSLAQSLWLTILWQSAMTVFVLRMLLKRLFEKEAAFETLAACIILATTTGMGIFVCQIKPDFFLPLITLSITAFFLGNDRNRLENILLLGIILLGSISHLSHLPMTTGLVVSALVISFIMRKKITVFSVKKAFTITLILLAAWLIAPTLNYAFTGSFTLSRVSNIFRVSKLIQAGIFQEYVNDRCGEDSTFYLCKYRDELKNYKTYMDFLWDEDSFLYDHPCQQKSRQQCWIVRNEEFGLLVGDIQSRPKYMKMIVADAIRTSAIQAVTVTVPDYTSYQEHAYPPEMARKYLRADRIFLERSAQSRRAFTFPLLNLAQLAMVVLSLLIIALYFINFNASKRSRKLTFVGLMIALTLIGNATFMGIFAGIAERFQSRIIWLIPFFAITLVLDYFRMKREHIH